MKEDGEELLNVYDASGCVVGTRPRQEAKASGMAVGAVNALIVNSGGKVLLQRRPLDKENGGRWDKSVGGHVAAGEDFDATLVREASEELFDESWSSRVLLASDPAAYAALLVQADLGREIVLLRVALHHNLRDVRHVPAGGLTNVTYHVAIYVGQTDVPQHGFRPRPGEIDGLRFVSPAEVDRLLLAGELAPNMAFLWLAQGHALLSLAAPSRRG